ncbi:MAG: decaprenyl-phosphate phosphoribosyltransferase [Candidatus Woesearchaeota archaeon]
MLNKMLKEIISLMRIKQWYKNLLIFLPLIFSGNLFNTKALSYTLIGFFAISLISSSNYIINDIRDRHKDRKHPEKKKRPIASRKITVPAGVFLAIVLIGTAFYISTSMPYTFRLILLIFFILTQLYTFFLKDEAFADITLISTNFVIRAVAGAFVLTEGMSPYVEISPWLILCPFFLAMFLAIGKREADLRFLKDKAISHKPVFKIYTLKITNTLMIISTTLLIMSYALYSFLSLSSNFLITIPIALYMIFRYFYLVESGNEVARHPELVYKDPKIFISGMLLTGMIIMLLYIA